MEIIFEKSFPDLERRLYRARLTHARNMLQLERAKAIQPEIPRDLRLGSEVYVELDLLEEAVEKGLNDTPSKTIFATMVNRESGVRYCVEYRQAIIKGINYRAEVL